MSGVAPTARGRRLPLVGAAALGAALLVGLSQAVVLAIALAAARENTVTLVAQKVTLALDVAEARLKGQLERIRAAAAALQRGASGDGEPSPEAFLALEPAIAAVWPGDGPELLLRGAVRHAAPPSLLGTLRRAEPGVWADAIPRVEGLGPILVLRPGAPNGPVLLVDAQELVRAVETPAILSGDEVVFVLHGPDHLLAHSRLRPPTPAAGDPVALPRLAASGDPVLAEMADSRPAILPGQRNLLIRAVPDDLPGGGRTFMLRALAGVGNLPLRLGIHAPDVALAAEVRRLRAALLVALAAVGAAVLTGALAARAVARPVAAAAARMEAVGRLELATVAPMPSSPFRELDAQAAAFGRMLAALRRLAAYVPRAHADRLIASGAAPGAERRDVTVMFTDIVGFTALTRGLEPEAVAAFLGHHFALVDAALARTGGTLDKFLGDGVLAFWDALPAAEDHAVRAAAAALAIARAVAAENTARVGRGEPPVRLRVGLHSGPVILGDLGAPGRVDYTVVGDTVTLATRLEQLGKEVAPAAECVVLASAITAARLGPGFQLAALGARSFRDGRGPVEVWRLLAD